MKTNLLHNLVEPILGRLGTAAAAALVGYGINADTANGVAIGIVAIGLVAVELAGRAYVHRWFK